MGKSQTEWGCTKQWYWFYCVKQLNHKQSEGEIWQRGHSKNLRDWFSKTWLPCDTLYFIFDAYAILIQSSNELALVQFTIVGLSHCQHFYADHGTELEMLEFT